MTKSPLGPATFLRLMLNAKVLPRVQLSEKAVPIGSYVIISAALELGLYGLAGWIERYSWHPDVKINAKGEATKIVESPCVLVRLDGEKCLISPWLEQDGAVWVWANEIRVQPCRSLGQAMSANGGKP